MQLSSPYALLALLAINLPTHALRTNKQEQSPTYMVETSATSDMRCDGAPENGWGGLGQGVSTEACEQACLSSATCNYAVFRITNNDCSAFSTCDMTKDGSKGPFSVYQKSPIMVELSANSEMRCHGGPENGWGGLGHGGTADECQQACMASSSCAFAVFNNACSAFSTCSMTKDADHGPFWVWQKVTLTTTTTTTTTMTTKTYVQGDGFVFDRCVNVKSVSDSQDFTGNPSTMTLKACYDFCGGFATSHYFGVKGGDQCWCGSTYMANFDAGPVNCDRPCAGDADKICGGATSSSVYIMSKTPCDSEAS